MIKKLAFVLALSPLFSGSVVAGDAPAGFDCNRECTASHCNMMTNAGVACAAFCPEHKAECMSHVPFAMKEQFEMRVEKKEAESAQ